MQPTAVVPRKADKLGHKCFSTFLVPLLTKNRARQSNTPGSDQACSEQLHRNGSSPPLLLLLLAMWSCVAVVVVERAVVVVLVLDGRSLLCSAIVQCYREEEK